MFASIHLRRSLWLSAVCLLAACEHAEGGVCQGSRDCEDGLVCDLSLDETRGVCRDPGDIDAGSDAGARPDAAEPLQPDASPDASLDSGMAGAGGAGGAGGAPADAGGAVDGGMNDLDSGSDADGG